MNSSSTLDITSTVLPIVFLLFFGTLSIGVFAFWIWMLVDCLKYESDEKNNKLVWIIVIIFANWIGALIYYFVRRKERLAALPKD